MRIVSTARAARDVRVTDVSSTDDLARVTIISSSRRVDLALPGSVTLGEQLPSILRFTGMEANSPTDAVHTWVLQRLGVDPFDLFVPVSELHLRDGETLYLRHREDAMPDAAFDDVVDAVASATTTRPSWAARHSQRLALAVTMCLLIGLPLLVLLAQPAVDPDLARVDPSVRIPFILAVAAAGFLGFAACIGAVALARAARATQTATALAWSSCALAGIAGWFVAEPFADVVPLAVRVILAASLILVAATACALGARVSVMALCAVALTAVLVVVTAAAMLLWPGHDVAVAAITMTAMAFVTTALPSLSYRVAGIALPNLPVTTEAMLADETPVQPDIVGRAILADKLLAALLAAASATAVLASLLVLTQSSLWSTLLVVCIAVAFLLRARAFVGFSQRLSLLLGGGVTLATALLAVGIAAAGSLTGMGVVLLLCLALTYGFAHYSAATYSRILSPSWGRWGDVLEWVAIIGIVPCLLGVMNLYAYFGTLF